MRETFNAINFRVWLNVECFLQHDIIKIIKIRTLVANREWYRSKNTGLKKHF